MKTFNFVTIDFEFTKESPERVCAIGMVKFIDGKPADTYYSLFCPLSLDINDLDIVNHGLTADDVKDAPTFDKIWDEVKAFIGDNIVTAYKAHSVISVLRDIIKWYNLEPTFDQLWNETNEFYDGGLLGTEDASLVMHRLNNVLKRHDQILEAGFFITYDLAWKTWRNLESYSLTDVASHLGIIYNTHNALYDALTCGTIVMLTAKEYGSTNLKELLNSC